MRRLLRKKAPLGAILAMLLTAAVAAYGEPAAEIDQLYQAGREAFAAGRIYEALDLLGVVAGRDPSYGDVQSLLGQVFLVAHLERQAQSHFKRALELNPRDAHAAFLLGLALYEEARYFEAAEALARAQDLAPENPHPRIYRGMSLLKLGRPDEARAEIEAGLARAPGEPTARLALAELELAAGRVEEAEALVRQVLAAAPRSLEGRILLGRILLQAGRPAEAVPGLRQILEAAPERSDVLYLLAQALLRSGDTEAGRSVMARFKAQKALEEKLRLLQAAVASDPQDLESRLRLARLLLENGQVRGARLQLWMLLEQAPGDGRVRALAEEVGALVRQQRPGSDPGE